MQQLIAQLKRLPATPGVYQFFDRAGVRLYVGKASNLKSRVQSYFRVSTDLSLAKQELVKNIWRIEHVDTASEIEALLLEASLIKKHLPRFNVMMRDDKSYVYIKVSTEEEWPRVFATRRLEKSGTYFGPFTSSYAVKETLRALRKIIPYRCNQRPLEIGNCPPAWTSSMRSRAGKLEIRKPRACLWYHLGRCPGTCIGAIPKTEYRKSIRRITLFLSGKMDALRRALKKEMGPDRAPLETRRPKVPVALPLAGRLLTGRVALMENVLAHTQLIATGEKFAYDAVALARVLHLPKPPERIEGYDISNTMGREATGAMVVFMNGEPMKSEYKRFKIKTVRDSDDVRMMEEVLARRLQHDTWPTPDLMIIDGGKAQLNAAVRTIKEYEKRKVALCPTGHKATYAIPVIAVAKGGHGGVLKQKEEIYFPGERAALKLPNSSSALHLVLRVRDEAHRFAIGYHKILRRKRFFS